MANDYYLEGEQLEEQLDEEASFYFMIRDFEHWVEKDGADFVIKRMNQDTFQKLSEWFYQASQPKKEVCKLLC